MSRLSLVVALALGTLALSWATENPPMAPDSRAQQDSTAALRALGEKIFKGSAAGGLCYTCHQPSGKGVPGLGSDLTDTVWLHGDGSVDSIAVTIEKGVPKPREASVPMLPGGGARLTRLQIRALAIFVKSLGSPSQ